MCKVKFVDVAQAYFPKCNNKFVISTLNCFVNFSGITYSSEQSDMHQGGLNTAVTAKNTGNPAFGQVTTNSFWF